jgi:hypothetical protein
VTLFKRAYDSLSNDPALLIIQMGWFWGSSEGEGTNKSDPVGKLDSSLRDFLQKESPVKYSPANTTPTESPTANSDQWSSQAPEQQPETAENPAAATSSVPPQSLYADGRYAHLWKTYQPLSEIENRNKTEQDKLLDVLENHKLRKAEIGRAALENCALEQWSVNDCFRNGSWISRMTMCRKENKELSRCFMMQSVGP